MRNKQTNFLQIVVIFTGILYITAGLLYFISPGFFASLIGLNVNNEWISQIAVDQFIFFFYTLSRALSVILFTSGIAMILPLFDPLKYRGLVYYNGLIFSGVVSVFLMVSGFVYRYKTLQIMAAVFIFQFVMTLIALMITRGNAIKGID